LPRLILGAITYKYTGCPPIFQKFFPVGIGTLAQKFLFEPGCRGFTGPVPPPLWIEVPWGLFSFYRLHAITNLFDCQSIVQYAPSYAAFRMRVNQRFQITMKRKDHSHKNNEYHNQQIDL